MRQATASLGSLMREIADAGRKTHTVTARRDADGRQRAWTTTSIITTKKTIITSSSPSIHRLDRDLFV